MAATPLSLSFFFATQSAAETVDPYMQIYTVPNGKYAEITSIVISNADIAVAYDYQLIKRTNEQTGDFSLINSGGADLFLTVRHFLKSGDSLLFFSNETTTSITISGMEYPMP